MQLVPTLLEKNPQNIIDQIIRLSPYFSVFQIDVVDGVFAPNKTPSAKELLPLLGSLSGEVKQKISFDYHLMTGDYEVEIEHIKAVNKEVRVRNVLVHSDLSPNYHLLSMNFPEFVFGAVLNSEDNVYEVMKSYDLKIFPVIQFMTVHVGFQGNPFIEVVLKKIEQLKIGGFSGQIFIDGGVNDQTVPLIMEKKYRPDVLCVGSYITRTEQLKERVLLLREQINPKGSGV